MRPDLRPVSAAPRRSRAAAFLRLPSAAELVRVGRIGSAVGLFFCLKVAVGLVLVSASAHRLSVPDFAIFSQLFLLLALLATVSAGGVQNGLVRKVALAKGDRGLERRAAAAAGCIAVGFGLLLLSASILFRDAVALGLTGSTASAWAITPIVVAASLGGFGVVGCAVLTGRGQAPLGLVLQACGLAAGGGAAFYGIARGDPVAAVLGFACGPVLTLLLVLPFIRDIRPRRLHRGELRGDVADLLGFSGTFLLVATIMPLTLFALRYLYRLEFGAGMLGYWLAGNRVSDVTSQLLGLLMQQFFLPRAAVVQDIAGARPLVRRTFLTATALMGSGLLVFVLGQDLLVRTFLSAQFLPAAPFIIGYLAGDVLRVPTSLAMHAALARGRLMLCVGIEAASAIVLSITVLTLCNGLGRTDGAYMGYLLANAVMALALFAIWRWLNRSVPTGG